jgi:hypothetical protein
MEKKVEKKVVKKVKKEVVQYFTDEMAKDIFPFQPSYKGSGTGKVGLVAIARPSYSK